MKDSAYENNNQFISLILTIALLIFIPLYYSIDQFFISTADEVINFWYQSERSTIQQGNILSAISKLQRPIDNSILIKGIIVKNKKSQELLKMGKDFKTNTVKTIPDEKIRYNRQGLAKYIYTLSGPNIIIYILVESYLPYFISAFFAVYLIILFFIFGYYIRRQAVILEEIKNKQKLNAMKLKIELDRMLISLAQQVSHDIRSPLAALNEIGKVENGLSAEHKALMNNAIARINDIADGLLNKKNTQTNGLTVELLEISPIIDAIIKEKNIIISHSSNIQISFTKNTHNNIKAKINKIEFERVISNILNNSIEATKKNQILTIDILLSENQDSLTIIIKDNGSGIPKHILEQLGENQVSHGKEDSKSGNGLGLYHAFSVIKQMNGHINIQSEINTGTTISITLPKSETIMPAQIILIDDDELVRTTWEWKAKKSGIKLISFKTSNEFISYHQTHNLPFNTPIFVDIDLGDENGINVCEDLFNRGFINLNLATGHCASDINKPDYIKSIQDKTFPSIF